MDIFIVKQFTSFLSDLSKSEDFHLKDENYLNSNLIMKLLQDFKDVDNCYFKYKVSI